MDKQLIERINTLEAQVIVLQRQMALAMEHRIATMPIGPISPCQPMQVSDWPTLDPYKVTCANGGPK